MRRWLYIPSGTIIPPTPDVLWMKASEDTAADGASVANIGDYSTESRTLNGSCTLHFGGQNGQKFWRFDGIGDTVARGSESTDPTSFYIVAKLLKPGSQQVIFDSGSNGLSTRRVVDMISTGTRIIRDGVVGVVTTGGYTAGTVHVFTGIINGASSVARIDGGGDVTGTIASGSNPSGGTRIGSSNDIAAFFGSDLYEVMVYSTVLSAGDNALAEGYLKQKYGL